MARILIVAAEFEPFSSSGINRISFFKQYLEKQGHFVAVLSTVTSAQNLPANTMIDKNNQGVLLGHYSGIEITTSAGGSGTAPADKNGLDITFTGNSDKFIPTIAQSEIDKLLA